MQCCGGVCQHRIVVRRRLAKSRPEGAAFMTAKIGGARRDRTADLLHAMQALSQLSYGPNRWKD
jgi:hypothetical protein